MRKFINDLLTIPDANSRLVYLLQGTATAIVIIMVGVAFVVTHDSSARDGFSDFMLVLIGGGSLGSVARGWQKKLGIAALGSSGAVVVSEDGKTTKPQGAAQESGLGVNKLQD